MNTIITKEYKAVTYTDWKHNPHEYFIGILNKGHRVAIGDRAGIEVIAHVQEQDYGFSIRVTISDNEQPNFVVSSNVFMPSNNPCYKATMDDVMECVGYAVERVLTFCDLGKNKNVGSTDRMDESTWRFSVELGSAINDRGLCLFKDIPSIKREAMLLVA